MKIEDIERDTKTRRGEGGGADDDDALEKMSNETVK